MMQKLPSHISRFIHQNHVVSFAVYGKNDFWAANCFYAFDSEQVRLIILTDKNTHHGLLMQENSHIVGTIAAQVETLTDIEGVQFSAHCTCLIDSTARQEALDCYYTRHPIARLKPSDVWEIRFDMIKHTGNKLVFAKKTIWEREEV
ncbi:hypothetical protein NYR77_04780 [Actinobacillus equuli subsp. haemolyticus]|uniref:hypothetical protein n=1 Tax=Actinobacillus equuli TaxID=718 RepID=UPI002442DBC1|nr:hypothetical protein [Actinobacillus equuli]WGE68348.1 hypothetical protein NYR77_04780 [Actinobacillus equuli subsp. haemolyticus]